MSPSLAALACERPSHLQSGNSLQSASPHPAPAARPCRLLSDAMLSRSPRVSPRPRPPIIVWARPSKHALVAVCCASITNPLTLLPSSRRMRPSHPASRRRRRRASASPQASPDPADDVPSNKQFLRWARSSQQAATINCGPPSARPCELHVPLTQSHGSKSQRCRRPPMRTAWPCSLRRCEDGLPHRSVSEHGLPGLLPLPGRAGYCLIGFEDAQRPPVPENLAESLRWGWLPPGAAFIVSTISQYCASLYGRIMFHTRLLRRMQPGIQLSAISPCASCPVLSCADGLVCLYL